MPPCATRRAFTPGHERRTPIVRDAARGRAVWSAPRLTAIRRSARASRQDGKKASARGAGRNLVEGAPVGTHDFPRDRGPCPRRAGPSIKRCTWLPRPDTRSATGRSAVPSSAFATRLVIACAIRSTSHSPSRCPLRTRWIARAGWTACISSTTVAAIIPILAGRREQGSEAPTRRSRRMPGRRRLAAARTVPPARTKRPSSWCDCPSISIHCATPASATIRASKTKAPGSVAMRSISAWTRNRSAG